MYVHSTVYKDKGRVGCTKEGSDELRKGRMLKEGWDGLRKGRMG